jgi:hypothetical protein
VFTAIQIVLWVLIAIPFVMAAFVCAFAVVASIFGKRSRPQDIEFLTDSACPKCRKKIGHDAVLAGIEAYAREAEKRAEDAKRRGVTIHVLVEWEIHCLNCASQFYFYPDTRKMESEPRFPRSQAQGAS